MKLTEYQKNLVVTHLKLAQRLALESWRRSPETMEKYEVVAVAYQGLISAALKFDQTWRPDDPKYDPFLAFGAFARQRINGSILDWQRSRDHVPKRQRQVYKNLQKHGHGAGRSAEELADITGLNVEKIRFITQAVESMDVSLDIYQEDGEGSTYYREVPSSQNVERVALASSIQGTAADTFRALPPLQRSILSLRYYQGLDLTQIAVELGVGVSVVRASHKDAIDLIHEAMRRAAS